MGMYCRLTYLISSHSQGEEISELLVLKDGDSLCPKES
jgi:hypothetical protein